MHKILRTNWRSIYPGKKRRTTSSFMGCWRITIWNRFCSNCNPNICFGWPNRRCITNDTSCVWNYLWRIYWSCHCRNTPTGCSWNVLWYNIKSTFEAKTLFEICYEPVVFLIVIFIVSLGFLLSTLFKEESTAMQAGIGSFYPLMMLSGILWPIEGILLLLIL